MKNKSIYCQNKKNSTTKKLTINNKNSKQFIYEFMNLDSFTSDCVESDFLD